ncbi:MAG: aminoglycoside phosphotransferase family protein [Cyclobacteriaceae bacterium]
MPTHLEAEVRVTERLVKQLIVSQNPDFAHISVVYLDAGWDNKNYRLGSDYLVRIPRRKEAAILLQNEIAWLPKLEKHLPISIPAPVRVGQPDSHYPWVWSIVPWFSGTTADRESLNETEALKLVAFLRVLHGQGSQNAPVNPFRAVPLAHKSDKVAQHLKEISAETDLVSDKLLALWQEAVAETSPSESCLIHGDLHPLNVIVQNGSISAIVDWGDITTGDAATDLASLWMLVDNKDVRQRALQEYGASESLVKRAIGWAIFLGIILLHTGLTVDAKYTNVGQRILKIINEE